MFIGPRSDSGSEVHSVKKETSSSPESESGWFFTSDQSRAGQRTIFSSRWPVFLFTNDGRARANLLQVLYHPKAFFHRYCDFLMFSVTVFCLNSLG